VGSLRRPSQCTRYTSDALRTNRWEQRAEFCSSQPVQEPRISAGSFLRVWPAQFMSRNETPRRAGRRVSLQAAPSSPISEVRLRPVFCHNLHILNRPRPVVSGIFERRKRRGKSNANWFHNTASETTAQFLVIRLWRDVHVVENKVNKVADFFVDFDCRRT